jgi:hypothetical protein
MTSMTKEVIEIAFRDKVSRIVMDSLLLLLVRGSTILQG